MSSITSAHVLPRPIAALVAANALSATANVIVMVAVPWLVLSTTGSAAITGLVVFASAGSAAVGGMIAGRVVDRIGPAAASSVSDLLSALAVLPLPILLAFDVLELWHVVGLVILGTVADAAGSTARQGMVPQIAARSAVSRERANAAVTSAEHLGYLLGAPIAGVLVAAVGSGGALAVTIGAFVIASTLVATAVRVERLTSATEPSDRPSLREAARLIRRDPALRALVAFPVTATFLIGPLVPIVLPVIAREVYRDPVVLGLLVASFGIGGLAGATLFGVVGERVSRRGGYVGVFVLWPLLYGGLAAMPPSLIAGGLLMILGTFAGALVPMQATIRQERTPPELLPRVVAVSTGPIPVVTPLAVLAAGLLLDGIGIGQTLLVMTAGTAALGIAAVLSRGIRTFDASRTAGPRGEAVAAASGQPHVVAEPA